MKELPLVCGAAVILALSAQAGIDYSSFANSGIIPDGNPSGWSGTASVGGYVPSAIDVSVSLNLSGGYNGDLYAYLSYGGALVPLLNRVGVGTGNTFGYSDGGLNITLSDSGANNIHLYQGLGSVADGSSWKPDGRSLDPLGSANNFDAAGTVTFANTFGGVLDPDGTWTLFIADMSSGGQSSLVSWSLNLTAVPEPVTLALGIFAGVFLVVLVVRSRSVRNRVQHWRAAAVEWINAV